MRAMSWAMLAAAGMCVPFLHHGHIEMFIADVRRRFERDRTSPGGRSHQVSSRLAVPSRAPSTRYEVAVRRKTRGVEIAVFFEGEPAAVDGWLSLLADHAAEIRAGLGNVEPERLKRTQARLRHVQVVSHGSDWSPKRDLTPPLVEDVSQRLSRFIELFEPIVSTMRGRSLAGRTTPSPAESARSRRRPPR
jgi:hypothetical protein